MIIALINQKGGVGKTTTAFNLGHGLARAGHRTLLIDLDPQANMSRWADAPHGTATAVDIFTDGANVEACIVGAGNVDIIPVTSDLAGIDMAIGGRPGWESRLRRAIEPIRRRYAYILIDCPPSLGLLTINALTAATGTLIPVQTKYMTLSGLKDLSETIANVREAYNSKLRSIGIVACMYDQRTSLAREVLAQLRQLPKDYGKIFDTVIRENIRLAEAPSWHQSIFEYAPVSHGAEDYENLTNELLRSA